MRITDSCSWGSGGGLFTEQSSPVVVDKEQGQDILKSERALCCGGSSEKFEKV